MVSYVNRDADRLYAIIYMEFLVIALKIKIFCQNSWPYKGIYIVKTAFSR